MATKVRGITIELGADTSGIQSALKSVNSSIKSTSTQLKDVNKLLKLDPSNTTLLAQKMDLLKSGVESTKSKIDTLAQTEEKLKAEMEAAGGGSDEQKAQLAALEREMIACQQESDKYEKELSELNKGHEEVADSADKTSSSESKLGDVLKTVGAAAADAAAAVAAAAVKLGTEVVESYAEYEQLVGGVETLFGESAAVVEEYAENAYKTAGLSANEYMETVTGFSASLLQSLGGDTEEAAKMADQAITDMSDNANKMGTDMASIQNAYQGFAKQNYTMLDNLKLGYGGTKEEMERLIDDANALAVAQGEAGDMTIDSYADIVEAIHLVQTEMGISGITIDEYNELVESGAMSADEAFELLGTTAKESESTISGSINTLEATWENFLTGLGNSDAEIEQLATDLMTAFSNVVTNIAPIVENLVNALPIAVQAIAEQLPTIIPTIMNAIQTLMTAIVQNMDVLLESILSIVDTLIDMIIECLPEILPKLVTLVLELITGIAQAIIENLGPILEAVWQCLLGILDAIGTWFFELVGLVDEEGDGIWDNVADWFLGILADIGTWLGNIWSNIASWFTGLISGIASWISSIWNAVTTWFTNLVSSIASWLSSLMSSIGSWFVSLITNVGTWVQGIWNSIASFFSRAWELGKNLVEGIWNGISGAASWLWGKITGWLSSVWDGIKSFFGVHSPSTQMAWIGEMLCRGLGEGIEDNGDIALDATNSMVQGINDAMNGLTDGSVTATVSGVNGLDGLNAQLGLSFDTFGTALNSILDVLNNGQKIYLDGDKLVGYTVKPMNVALGKLSAMEARA